ncbi:transposase [Anaeromyxobacter sp. PSR-1]|uniref:transposase n=1 Tax=Anaeromyxobacter sp. PSR-1 TaxID=1300915 RepID=UPI0013649308|nr:transposase [Anaeromyxobacter sp. PSR-1]
MASEKPRSQRRPRRSFTDEFKAEVVKKVLVGHKTSGQVARDLDLTETAVRHWVKQAQVDRGKGPPGALTTAEKEELARLRKENRELREDREIQKKRRPWSIPANGSKPSHDSHGLAEVPVRPLRRARGLDRL